jgi:hypothetical protein
MSDFVCKCGCKIATKASLIGEWQDKLIYQDIFGIKLKHSVFTDIFQALIVNCFNCGAEIGLYFVESDEKHLEFTYGLTISQGIEIKAVYRYYIEIEQGLGELKDKIHKFSNKIDNIENKVRQLNANRQN